MFVHNDKCNVGEMTSCGEHLVYGIRYHAISKLYNTINVKLFNIKLAIRKAPVDHTYINSNMHNFRQSAGSNKYPKGLTKCLYCIIYAHSNTGSCT